VPRANRYHIPGCIWHITHRCHKREFLLKFARGKIGTMPSRILPCVIVSLIESVPPNCSAMRAWRISRPVSGIGPQPGRRPILDERSSGARAGSTAATTRSTLSAVRSNPSGENPPPPTGIATRGSVATGLSRTSNYAYGGGPIPAKLRWRHAGMHPELPTNVKPSFRGDELTHRQQLGLVRPQSAQSVPNLQPLWGGGPQRWSRQSTGYELARECISKI
jgi:hypothetical protein